MSIGKKVRFEILKRDGFRCQYCGRGQPQVVLHVDHIHPKALGGSDKPNNLRAACADCNIGKGARTLPDGTIAPRYDNWPARLTLPVFFASAEWAVTEYGMESLTQDYPIEAEALSTAIAISTGEWVYQWPCHIAEKSWGEIEDFIACFRRALEIHGSKINEGMWGNTLKHARRADAISNLTGDDLALLSMTSAIVKRTAA